MKKFYVLDTNVLIHDPESIFKFEDNIVVIPIAVVEELDGLKKGPGEIAYSARHSLKIIDSFRETGDLSKGVDNKQGGSLQVKISGSKNEDADSRIINCALELKYNSDSVVLVSKDTAVRIKAQTNGLTVQDYIHDKTSLFESYGNLLSTEDYTNGILSTRYIKSENDIYKIQGENRQTKIKSAKSLDGIQPKNNEQRCAIDALISPDIEIVALTGAAGTGKTLLALAAGIHQTTKKSPLYEQVLVARPVMPLGNDIGFLPGDVSEKMIPWMQPIFDNLEVIVHTPKGQIKDDSNSSSYKSYQYLIDSGVIAVEPLTYIRGRSLPNRYFIIDESQNLRPIDIKTIVTRCGEGTKIIFTGDIDQIDTPYLDRTSNGLAYLISKFINQENFCYLNLKGSVRSKLAEQGALLL